MRIFSLLCTACFFYTACNNNMPAENETKQSLAKGTYAYDRDFLKTHTKNVLELISADSSAKVLLSADFQGRVMTSTAMGDTGLSFGWLNYDLIAAPEKKKQFNPVGGEERFWLGPEGGQYSIYFKGKDSFDINHWQVPAIIDTIPYAVKSSDNSSAVFTQKATFDNYSGTTFDIEIERTIRLLNRADIAQRLSSSIPDELQVVGYETINNISNTGAAVWQKDKGLLSIWLLGMFAPTPQTMVIIPFRPIKNAREHISDDYFGSIPPGRLQIKDSVLCFFCDGKYRSKIGLSPEIAKPLAASFDFKNNVLTLVIPQVEPDASYVNSKWEIQKQPYKGDVINSYNDGPLADGQQLGPFYEIESSSPALQLAKGSTGTYKQITCHVQGNYQLLKQLAAELLAVNLDDIKGSLDSKRADRLAAK